MSTESTSRLRVHNISRSLGGHGAARELSIANSLGNPVPLASGARIERHLHAAPYATFVLEGGYEEAGDGGRLRVGPGDVLLHSAYSAHWDRIGRLTLVLDLPLPSNAHAWPAIGRVRDGDLIIRVARRDVCEAQALLIEGFAAEDRPFEEPADLLAAALRQDATLSIGRWASAHGVSREGLSRQFRALYGIDSAGYRAEARARWAWRRAVGTDAPLTDIAADTGFADQAHMTRAVRALTGAPPGYWRRRAVTSVQDRALALL